MTLENMVLEKLSEWQAPPGRHDLHVADPASGWSVTITADRCDVLGCLLWEMTVCRAAVVADLTDWANRLAERVSGLMEPLKVVEVDTSRKEAQLRSESPLERADQRFYYEVVLVGNGSVTLRRFLGATATTRREQVTFALTHEALAKLVGDVIASF